MVNTPRMLGTLRGYWDQDHASYTVYEGHRVTDNTPQARRTSDLNELALNLMLLIYHLITAVEVARG